MILFFHLIFVYFFRHNFFYLKSLYFNSFDLTSPSLTTLTMQMRRTLRMARAVQRKISQLRRVSSFLKSSPGRLTPTLRRYVRLHIQVKLQNMCTDHLLRRLTLCRTQLLNYYFILPNIVLCCTCFILNYPSHFFVVLFLHLSLFLFLTLSFYLSLLVSLSTISHEFRYSTINA